MTKPSSSEYFYQSSMIPSILITDWRVVRVAPGIVRMTVFERSSAAEGPDGAIVEVLHARGSFCLSLDSFLAFTSHVDEMRKHLGIPEASPPIPTNEGNRSMN